MNWIICHDCGLHYEVVWSNDWSRSNGIDMPFQYCPACGSEDIALPEDEEAD